MSFVTVAEYRRAWSVKDTMMDSRFCEWHIPMLNSVRNRLHKASVRAVFPEPTGLE